MPHLRSLAVVLTATACAHAPPLDPSRVALLEGRRVEGPVVVAHGGVGSAAELSDGPAKAAAMGLTRLAAGESALEAALEGTVTLEDDPRFNAGTGANIRLDGRTIQMDAALMTSDGRFAAVAVIERVTNPVRVARAVLDTPHVLLAGEGATRFAHRVGFADVVPETAAARTRHRARVEAVRAKLRLGEGVDWPALWNFPNPLPPELDGDTDTVGTVARDARGVFAATLSTGGTSVTLYGRVGDVPIPGAGLYAGPAGAVACTGTGEAIIRTALAREVYRALEAGTSAPEAVATAVARFPPDADVGIIAVDRSGWGVAADARMAFGVASAR